MIIARQDAPKSEVILTVTISTEEVKKAYHKALEKIAENIEIKGFRKGKAPVSLVEKEVDKKLIYEEVLKDLISDSYKKAVDQEQIRPIIPPKAEMVYPELSRGVATEEGKDWIIKFTACLKPPVKLKAYKKAIQNLKVSKKPKLFVPGKPEPDEKDTKPTLDEILTTLLTESEVEISDLLASEEANRQLSKLVDQLQKLGLTVDQYIASKNTTVENLRAGYLNQAKDTLKLEFILDEIANSENITVTDDDIKKALESVPDEKEKEALKKEQYYLSAIIRKQKTIEFLENI